MSDLRGYQADLLERVRGAYREGHRRVLMVLPTGGGKTRVAAEVLRLVAARGNRGLFLADLDTLVQDTHGRLTDAGIRAGFVQAGRPTDPEALVQVCSLDTMHARGLYPPADFIFLDEAHHAKASTIMQTLSQYPRAQLLGGTATAQRGDGDPLGDVFEIMVSGPSVKELTALGHLVPCEVISPELPADSGTIADYPDDAYIAHGGDRPAIVFCGTVEDAERSGDRFAARGYPTEIVTGETTRRVRDGLRDRLASGQTKILVGCNVFLEGFDAPPLEVAILARGFGVCGTYLQACGRVLRPHAGKTRATIIDLAGAAIEHGLPQDDRIWSLSGPPKRVGDDLKLALTRCRQCFAVLHAGPRDCPRCGASLKGCKVKRRATRVERQELQRLDTRPQHVRDEIAIKGIEKRLRASGRFTEAQIPRIAASIFAKKQRRPAA